MGSPHNVAALCLAVLGVLCLSTSSLADYNIGVGIADITGPSVEVNFMGYANLEQTGRGIHLRQFARSFIIEDENQNRVAFVSTDTGMMSTGLRKEVLRQLNKVYGSTYNQSNLIISGTHTHSGPGGFNMDLLFDITILGFVQQTFHSYAAGIVRSIKMAHESMTPGKLHYKEGRLVNTNINRSPSSYLLNPEAERNLYPDGDTDKKMAQLKMVSTNGTLLGAISWFAIHPTSMNNTNVLVSSDNVGYASVLLEEAINPPGTFPGKGKFVGAFASTNLGDISPNIMGPKCEFTGVSCDIHSSRCVNPDEKCFAQGPGKDMFDSTKIIAQRIKTEGLRLLQSQDDFEVTGPIKTIHQFIDMAHISVPDYNPRTGQFMRDAPVRGCLPAMGYSFAAGTTDGPGAFNFSQGTTTGNPLWNSVRNLLAEPTIDDIECQKPKPILLATGRITFPYEWQPTIVSSQLALIGDVVLAAVPGEFTTMSGRRMRSVLTNTFAAAGKDVKVVVAGLSNTYSDYVATPEEYQAQRYEAASTIFGPHTLTIHLNQFNDLAKALIEDRTLDPGPTPTDFSNDLISLVTPVIFDIAPWGLAFGECVVEPNERYTFGNVVHVKFVSGNPRNNLMTEKSYLTVERFIEQDSSWEVVATDAHWETRFVWERTSLILGTSKVNIYWEVTDKAPVGTYRIQHFGYFRYILGSTKAYSGKSRTFQIY